MNSRDVTEWLASDAGRDWIGAVHVPVRTRNRVGVIATVEPQPRGSSGDYSPMRGPVNPRYDPCGAPPIARVGT